ncbi:MAG: hypothetical protein IJO81_04310 [Clostridia bacterium]|nr:hypothetical protein [Clostridia bacterium]
MENFNGYFLKEKKLFLENINYETVKSDKKALMRLGCRDTVVAQLIADRGVKVIFNRRLAFEPEALFTLSVSFGVFLRFDPSRIGEVNWQEVNIVNEFTKANPAIMSELNARTTLLVSQITSSAGGVPIVTGNPHEPKPAVQ